MGGGKSWLGAGFNGATPLRVWKDAKRSDGPDNTRQRFNGATPLRVWKDARPPPTMQSWHCFNGATPLRVWKVIACRD